MGRLALRNGKNGDIMILPNANEKLSAPGEKVPRGNLGLQDQRLADGGMLNRTGESKAENRAIGQCKG